MAIIKIYLIASIYPLIYIKCEEYLQEFYYFFNVPKN